jgi:CII-binding regulator of phage lambda lysogenization HflD
MTGLQILQTLPISVQEQIIAKYSSLDAFYTSVLTLYREDYTAHMKKDRSKQSEIQNQIWDIEEKLESFGLDFMVADEVISEIRNDYTSIVAANYLQKKGFL